MELVGPNGNYIQGTSETILAAAHVNWTDGVGDCGYDHQGGSEVFWDTSTTDSIDGVSMFTDESGNDWLQHHLIPEGIPPLEDDCIEALLRETTCGRALEDAKRLKERKALSGHHHALLDKIIVDLAAEYAIHKQFSLNLVKAHLEANPVEEEEEATA